MSEPTAVHSEQVIEFLFRTSSKVYNKKPLQVKVVIAPFRIPIPTLEGTMIANEGDYIICGVNGEYYPCKPDIFKKTYEPLPKEAPHE